MEFFNRQEDSSIERELARLQQDMNRLVRRPANRTLQRGTRGFPGIVISTRADGLYVRAEVPGMKLEDLDISVSGDVLTIQGVRATGATLEGGWYHRRERESGGFSRSVRLPAEVDGGKAEATYVAGVLTISLPLKAAAKPREIAVRVVEG
jgi:HSP20 family protein